MSDAERIKKLEDTVSRLKVETWVLKELMMQQVRLNNITYKGKYDEVIISIAKEYESRGLDNEENREVHDTLRQYLKAENDSE
ncbi:hypothetical protein GNG27_10255 [Leclercia sp. 119287]|nr:hypothetical protein GNG27_10255 [Leclercia sp. 119287]